EARAVVVALVEDEDLRLVLEATEGRRVHDAVAVALELAPGRGRRFRVQPPPALPRVAGVRGRPSLAEPTHASPRVEAAAPRPYLPGETGGKRRPPEGFRSMTGIVLTDRAARRIKEIMAAEPAGSM